MITSRKTSDLLPQVEDLALELVRLCGEASIDLIVTRTYSDFEAQTKLYAQGRTQIGEIVTWAEAGESWHNWQRAFDVVPVVKGKAVWDDDLVWGKIGKIGRDLGLEWGGDWRKKKDRPHFQYTEHLTLGSLLEQHPKGLTL
ncbi:MAG: M15 family metallopeptidase [Alphaproteobacteria bacterium]|nr:M15 family metallopeptidase [Alphaproteobacteria bacterium]